MNTDTKEVAAAADRYPWRPMLDVSTAHITKDDAEALELRDTWPVVHQDQYGWIIRINTDEPDHRDSHLTDLASLMAVMDYAANLGANFIKLDADAHIHNNLPTHQW